MTIYFDTIVGSDNLYSGVNEIERLRFFRYSNKENIYVGDTQSDYVSARAVNYRFLFASSGYESFADRVSMGSPLELLKYINA